MTILSPKATRFVARAMRDASDMDKAIWAAIDHDTSKDIPPAAVSVALTALGLYEQRLRARLNSGALDEDETADLSNDLGFVCSLERGLRNAAPARRRELVEAAD